MIEWIPISTAEIERGQARLGMSDERIARLLGLSSKTWGRYRKRGAIPAHLMPRIAPVMGWELVEPEPVKVAVASNGTRPTDSALVSGQVSALIEITCDLVESNRRIEQALTRIEKKLG